MRHCFSTVLEGLVLKKVCQLLPCSAGGRRIQVASSRKGAFNNKVAHAPVVCGASGLLQAYKDL